MGETIELPIDGPDDPYTPEQIAVLSRRIARRLIEINEAQVVNNERWVDAKRALGAKREPMVIESYRADPKAPKWVHEAAADAACVDEAATAFMWERMVRSHNDEAHSLRQIQSWMQTMYKDASYLAGGRR